MLVNETLEPQDLTCDRIVFLLQQQHAVIFFLEYIYRVLGKNCDIKEEEEV